MGFLDEDYLLDTASARELYENIANMPIVDPHTHADIGEIVENDGWDDIWEVEAATDHYVWTIMRKRGVPEELITGDAPNREKWNALAEIFPKSAGNPTYEWLHLDLKRRFGIETPVSSDTADEIWNETKARLETDALRPQTLLREMGVEALCSTDDPTSSLEFHERAADEVGGVEILPTWRGDRAVKIDSPEWMDFVNEISEATSIDTTDFEGFLDALATSHDYFADHGCRAVDLGTGTTPVSRPVSESRARTIFRKRREGRTIDESEIADYKAFLLEFLGAMNADKGWVTQLHIGPVRHYRDTLYENVGRAAGGTVSTQEVDIARDLRYFLNRFDEELEIVLYCVDPTHYPTISTMARAFPNVSVGPAWWFNDSAYGMEHQLQHVGTVDLLANHAGMVSDSRKLLSFGSRFEMFRRSLANVVGEQVDRGQMPISVAKDLVEHVAYDRPKGLYDF